jgi:organic radical activating enzyme
MMACPHSESVRTAACDLRCPLCMEDEIERLRGLLDDACVVFDHYELPEHALHFRRALARERASE